LCKSFCVVHAFRKTAIMQNLQPLRYAVPYETTPTTINPVALFYSQPQPQGVPAIISVPSHSIPQTVTQSPVRNYAQPTIVNSPILNMGIDFVVGTENDFWMAAIIAFFFGLLGWIILLCVSKTHAHRYGSCFGFGLILTIIGAVIVGIVSSASTTNVEFIPIYVGIATAIIGITMCLLACKRWKEVGKYYSRLQETNIEMA